MLKVAFYLRVFNKLIKNHVKQNNVFVSWTECKICIDVIVIFREQK